MHFLNQSTFRFAFLLVILCLISISCSTRSEADKPKDQMADDDLSRHVDPFIGTHKMGHTFPGAAVPFGMVQLSPETNIPPMYIDGRYNPKVYQYCAGYQYADSTIFGFAHTHFSGTGHSDLGDFLIMPQTGSIDLNPGEPGIPGSGYFSYFSHENEHAEPGFYKVYLNDYELEAELTASEHVGFHRYTYPEATKARIILDMMHNIYHFEGKNVWTFIRVENDSLITGYRQTHGWARTRKVYFAMQFSEPLINYGHKKYDEVPYNGFYRKFDEAENFPEMAGRKLRAYFEFDPPKDRKLLIKFALSAVSTQGAIKNLEAEIPHWNFEETKSLARQKWNGELSKIKVETLRPEDKKIFYTAFYHSMLNPVIFEDVDGSYRGLDQNIHQSEGFKNYSIFSLWDTFRALHPLYNLIQPERNVDFIKSMLVHQEQSVHGMLPVWSHYANENWCMIGYHAVPVIADAVAKSNDGFDTQKALQACVSSSGIPYYDGTGDYIKYGYVPADKHSSSVSKTLEYAYDDWCIAQLAKKLGHIDIHDEYLSRSNNFTNLYDRQSGFMRPKLGNGEWMSEFDPMDTHGQGFIEGNAWTYSLFVPHQPELLIEMMGGPEKFTTHLDSLFTMELSDEYIKHTEDITRDGIIGNYVHGNEPGHHIPYLYNYAGYPHKTQERVRMIMNKMYGTGPDGLCGNDDAGQMSAWYIFSALGFYPLCPGSDEYAIGSPLIKSASFSPGNGKTFNIETIRQSEENIYVQKVVLNGKTLKEPVLKHKHILDGGTLVFYMNDTP